METATNFVITLNNPYLIDISFILGSQNVDFLGYLGRNSRLAQKYTNFLSQRRYYVPQVSINCLACPKGVKYK
jgi:hypothetical protein